MISDEKTCDEKARHKELHAALDELVACFLVKTNGRPSATTVLELMVWSATQLPGSTGFVENIVRTLEWQSIGSHEEAFVGDYAGGDGVRFTLEHRPTCYRRGPWRLLIEVAGGPNHHKWGCFDLDDQPERNYHHEGAARLEAQAIAHVLVLDRAKRDKPSTPSMHEGRVLGLKGHCSICDAEPSEACR